MPNLIEQFATQLAKVLAPLINKVFEEQWPKIAVIIDRKLDEWLPKILDTIGTELTKWLPKIIKTIVVSMSAAAGQLTVDTGDKLARVIPGEVDDHIIDTITHTIQDNLRRIGE